ncbi:hypothetical protein [Microbacterium testaceum]|uniref:hypothetical protein n=1 Tax=Microbacterium testaceum TaxID=2033 RepID=UPI001245E4D6|nr:hypothetical protein [Microbacterium testaceum]
MASADDLAAQLYVRAVARGQAVVRCDASTPVADIRESVRARAKADGIRVRTGMMQDVLVVARADADLWSDDTPTMRAKLTAPAAVGVVA